MLGVVITNPLTEVMVELAHAVTPFVRDAATLRHHLGQLRKVQLAIDGIELQLADTHPHEAMRRLCVGMNRLAEALERKASRHRLRIYQSAIDACGAVCE
jgi:hypothetical protein